MGGSGVDSHRTWLGKSEMGLSYMGLQCFKEIAKMSLELLGLLLVVAAAAAAAPAAAASAACT